jgi:hypothetical protein
MGVSGRELFICACSFGFRVIELVRLELHALLGDSEFGLRNAIWWKCLTRLKGFVSVM